MEFAGKRFEEQDYTHGAALASRLMAADRLPAAEMKAEVDTIRAGVSEAIDTNMDAAVTFIVAGAEACESKSYDRFVYDYGQALSQTAVDIYAKDSELGKRLFHYLLTRQNPNFTDGVWVRLARLYDSGNVAYDDYHKALVVRHLLA